MEAPKGNPMIVATQSGSIYEFADNFTQMRRANDIDKLRKDGEWVEVFGLLQPPKVGECLVIFLEPLNTEYPQGTTIRQSTPVTSIIEDPNE